MGRRRKLNSSEAASVQHRGPGWSPPAPIIIFDMPPMVFPTTEQMFKDHVQLYTGSPKTQAAVAAKLGCHVPPRRSPFGYRPNLSHSPPPANAIPDPSLAAAIVPLQHNEERHHAASTSFVSDDYATTSDGAVVAMASADALSGFHHHHRRRFCTFLDTHFPDSSEAVNDVSFQNNQEFLVAAAGQNFQQYSSYLPLDHSLSADASFLHNQELLLSADGQNNQQYYSYVPPNPSLSTANVPSWQNQEFLFAAGGQNFQQYSPYFLHDPSPSAVVPTQHNEETGHLAGAVPYAASASIFSNGYATTPTAVFPMVSNGGVPTASADALSTPPSSSIILDRVTALLMSDDDLGDIADSALTPSSSSLLNKEANTDLRGSNSLIVTLPTGAAVQISNGNVFAGAPATRPSSKDKLADSNSVANAMDQFLEENDDNHDWSWIYDNV